MPDPAKPRITLALGDAELRRRLERLLEAAELDVEILQTSDDLIGDLKDRPSDLVVVRPEDHDADELAAVAQDDDSPTLVVVEDEAAAEERANLVASGVARVLSSDRPGGELRSALEALVEAEASGGLEGPDVGGAGPQPSLADFLSRSPRMLAFMDEVARVAASETTLLLTGESGVGKERLARAIHAASPRADGPFVAVNCGAVPENLLESELFGHVAGAFTGADKARTGRFEEANGGTIFLDEIGEMPKHLQVKLLTVLQSLRVRPVGSDRERAVDARIMAATNRDLAQEVEARRFREDLYFRLNVVPLRIPALRERTEDVPELVGTCIRHLRDRTGRTEVEGISRGALDVLTRYPWPGNIRELINVLERALLLCRGRTITVDDLPRELSAPRRQAPEAAPLPLELSLKEARRLVVDRFEREYLVALLEETGGVVGETATRAGITPRSLYDKMKKHGLRKEDFRS